MFRWPQDRAIFYWDFRHKLKRAYLLADGERQPLKVDVYRRSVMVHVPPDAPDSIDSVVVLEYESA